MLHCDRQSEGLKVQYFIANKEVIMAGFLFIRNGDYGPSFRCPFEVKFGPAHKKGLQTERLAVSLAPLYTVCLSFH